MVTVAITPNASGARILAKTMFVSGVIIFATISEIVDHFVAFSILFLILYTATKYTPSHLNYKVSKKQINFVQNYLI